MYLTILYHFLCKNISRQHKASSFWTAWRLNRWSRGGPTPSAARSTFEVPKAGRSQARTDHLRQGAETRFQQVFSHIFLGKDEGWCSMMILEYIRTCFKWRRFGLDSSYMTSGRWYAWPFKQTILRSEAAKRPLHSALGFHMFPLDNVWGSKTEPPRDLVRTKMLLHDSW